METFHALFARPTGKQKVPKKIQHLAELPLLRSAIVELPAKFDSQSDHRNLIIPRALVGNEHHVCYLVLDLEIILRHDADNREIGRACDALQGLRRPFPNLKTCLLSLFILDAHRNATYFDPNCQFVNRWLMHVGEEGQVERQLLKPALIQLFESFALQGPGNCRLVKFTHEITTKLTCVRWAHGGDRPLRNERGTDVRCSVWDYERAQR